MGSRKLNKTKIKVIVFFLLIVIALCLVYIYLSNIQHDIRSAEWSNSRCYSELSTTKFQLSVVTEYKNRIDKILLETQAAHNTDKEKIKDVMESCITMKQQSSICQSQFEDLRTECKNLKEFHNNQKNEYLKLKEQYRILEQMNQNLESEVKVLYKQIQREQQDARAEAPVKSYNGRSFSKLVEESEGEYKIDMQSGL